MDYRSEVFKLSCEIDETHYRASSLVKYVKALRAVRGRRVCRARTWGRKEHRLGFRSRISGTHMHLQSELPEVIEQVAGSGDEVSTSLEKDSAVVCVERRPKVKACGSSLTCGALA